MTTYPRELYTFTAEGFESKAFEEQPRGRCYMLCDFDVDVDGSGSAHGDPYYQPDTTLHLHGHPLNADIHRYIVLPPQLLKKVIPVVLGCLARVTYRGRHATAVVGDVGPVRKNGEGSYCLAQALDINPSPINGGVDSASVLYEWWPGVPAVIDGVTFQLQPYHG